MSSEKALVVYRQSKGTDDSISLTRQREEVPKLVRETGAEVVKELDIGVHTGYSIHSRDYDERRIDAREDVQTTLNELRDGEYDIVCAWDERRLARDKFLHEWERSAALGDAKFLFKRSRSDDEMTADVKRAVENHLKKQEIEESRDAVARRVDAGYWQGGVPTGMRTDESGNYLIKDEEEWWVVEHILEEWYSSEDVSERGIATDVPVSHVTVGKIIERREVYEAVDRGAKIGYAYEIVLPDDDV